MPDVELPQGTIRYRDEGEGPVVVFIHGALVDARLWDPVVERLRGTARCIAPDLPLGSHTLPVREDADLSPHGLADLIAAFLEALDLHDVTLVGSDTGGALCQFVVVRHPERVGRLVLTDCDAFEEFPPKAFRPMVKAARVPGALKAMLAPMRARRLRRLPLAYGLLLKRPVPDEVMDGWVLPALDDPLVLRDLRKVLAGLDAGLLLDNAARLGEFDRPVLIAWAREDRFFGVGLARRLGATFPDARVVELDDAYAFLSWDQPDRLAALIAEHVGRPQPTVAIA